MSKSYIHGEQSRTLASEKVEKISPITGQRLFDVDCASAQEVDHAVESAEQGFTQWSKMNGTQRGRILMQASRLLRERSADLARLEVEDTGKPISEALSTDIPSAADAIEYFAGLAPTIHGDHVDLGESFVYTRREPLGVCAGIGAWNYPLQIACWKSAPALAAGNAMVYKPSELTPRSALVLAEIYSEAGLPPGVFNVVQGAAATGQSLVSHAKVRKVSLTGSVATGKRVMGLAAETLKHVTLELGGKSPLIIFEDARLDQAVSAILMANFYTQGEVCSNGTRVFVEESIYDALLDCLIPRVNQIRIGDPRDPATQMGALISRAHLDRVMGYVEKAKQEGATLLCGGNPLQWSSKDTELRGGFFMQPVVFGHCTDSMTHVREEIFGPVMSILPFRSSAQDTEVLRRANDTPFGLAAGVFTQNIQRAHRAVTALQAGTCWINNYNLTPVEVPFGGVRQSGLGRENGLAALQHYTQLKSVYVEMGDVASVF